MTQRETAQNLIDILTNSNINSWYLLPHNKQHCYQVTAPIIFNKLWQATTNNVNYVIIGDLFVLIENGE